MAEEKLGTLQYDMLVNQKKLDDQLEDITKKLQEKDKQWKEILSGQGNVITPKINVSDLGNLTKANEAIATSTINIKTSIEKLKTELSESVKAYEALTKAKRDDEKVGGVLLNNIQTQKDQLNEYNKVLRQSIDARKLAAQQSKDELSAKQALESQRSKAFVKSNLDEEKRITDEIKKQESALRSLESQRSKAFVRGEVEKEKQITREIKEQQAAIRSLEAQRSRAFVASQTKQLREEQLATKAAWQEQKLKIAVDNQAAGSIERLRAQYALLKFQLSQVKFSDPNAVASVQKLQTAIAGVKTEIQALQPTLGIWGKLTSAIRTYATAYLSVQAVLGLGRAIYGQTKELDSLDFSMKTVIKSSTELAQTQKFLSEVAVNYGGDLLTLSERYIKFRAAAVQSNVSAAQTQKIFESVSKAAGTLGLRTDELSGTYLALEQMLSKGKVTTEELRRQLGERLPGAFGIMANALGVTIPELDKMLKKGEVLSTVALPKFAAALEKAYGIESLKKIDTLAAAQGRLSTEFTGLIKGLQASDTFKGAINGVASFLGFIKDNIGAITILSKALVGLIITNATYKAILTASVPIQRTLLLLTGNQTAALTQLSFAQKRVIAGQAAAIAGTTMWARAWNALKIAFLSNPLGVILTGLTLIGTALYAISGRTKEAQRGIVSFADNLSKEKSKLDQLFNSLQKAGKSTYEYKDALFQINNLYGKYLPNLLTEKSNIDEVTKARILANKSLEEEMMLRERSSRLEAASAKKDQVMSEIMADILAASPSITAEKKGLIFARIMDIANIGELDPEKRKALISKAFKGDLSAIEEYVSKATYALEGYKAKVASIDAFFSARESKKVDLFDPEMIEKAKKDFEEYSKLQSQGAGQLMISPFIDKDNQTLRQWLENQIKLYKGNEDALRSLYLAMAELDKNQNSSASRLAKIAEDRAEAIKKLNDKYLADQEDFANYEMGIQATRIANMEDGLDKEIKLNELAYEKRIAAIEKEKIARLKLLNEAAGIRTGAANEITSFDATGYSPEITELIRKANENDLQSRKNAKQDQVESDLKTEKDYQYKIAELRRDANDQFLSGIEKERAAIDEKYDDWLKKAAATNDITLMADVEIGRKIAQSELDKQYAIDQLDFAREIEYKKNEIANFGAANRRKLDKANFDTYVSFERQRIKILKSSESVDKQREGLTAEQKLRQDEILQGLTEEEQLRNDILKAAASLSDILATNLGLSEAQSKQIDLAISSLQNIASGDYISAAAGLLSSILDKQSALDFSNLEDKLAKPWEEFEKWIAASNRGLQQYIKLRDEAIGVDKYSASTMVIEEQQRKLAEYQEKLDNLSFSLKISGDGWFNKPYTEIDNQLTDLEQKLGGIFNQEGELKEWGLGFWKSVSGVFSFDLSQILYDNLGQFDITKINELINQGLITDESVIKAVDDYITLKDAIKEAEAAKRELLTATVADTLAQSLTDGFKNGLSSAADFADTFEGFIRGAIDNALKILSEPDFKKWYTDFAAAMESEGMLTSDEIAGLRESWNAIIERQKANRDAVYAISGLPSVASEGTGTSISKGIQALTEDTGRRLEGLINSIRETSVMNMGNTKQLVESSQMIQGYAAQSLGHLRNIDMTTSEQLKLLNSVVFSGHSKGGAGIKTFTD